MTLRFRPPDRPAFELRALVRRLDADGPAVMFLGAHGRDIPLALAAPAATEPRAQATETVLLVQADAATRAFARDVLQADGYSVLDAGTDPVGAVRIAREHGGPIHLLVSDLVMPLMSGLQLVERLRPLRPSMKLLFVSADPASRVPLPGARILPKPFTPDALSEKVREVLEGRSPFARPAGAPPRN